MANTATIEYTLNTADSKVTQFITTSRPGAGFSVDAAHPVSAPIRDNTSPLAGRGQSHNLTGVSVFPIFTRECWDSNRRTTACSPFIAEYPAAHGK